MSYYRRTLSYYSEHQKPFCKHCCNSKEYQSYFNTLKQFVRDNKDTVKIFTNCIQSDLMSNSVSVAKLYAEADNSIYLKLISNSDQIYLQTITYPKDKYHYSNGFLAKDIRALSIQMLWTAYIEVDAEQKSS